MRFFCFVFSILFLFSCSGKENSGEKINFGVLKGPSALAFAGAMTDEYISRMPVPVDYSVYTAPDMLIPLLVKGDLDGCILPVNVAATLYNRNPSLVKVWGICGNGMLSVVTTDPEINTLEDLEGNKINIGGMGATPEYLFKYLLLKNGIKNDSVETDYSLAPSEIVPAMAGGLLKTALLPEPFTTLALEKVDGSRIPFSVGQLYSQASGFENYPMTVIVFRGDFVKENKSLIAGFIKVWEESLAWTLDNPGKAAEKAETLGLGLTKAVAEKAIPKANLVHIPSGEYPAGIEGKKSIDYLLGLFQSFAPESIGGGVPGEDFYIRF